VKGARAEDPLEVATVVQGRSIPERLVSLVLDLYDLLERPRAARDE
jgi:hypothetical protein